MRNDDEFVLPVFRPRMGRRWRAAETTFQRAVLRRAGVAAAVRALGHATRRTLRRARIAVRRPSPLSRRVVIKAHYVKMTPYGAKAAALHLRYIERDGVAPDGSPGRLYGGEGPCVREVFEQPRAGERHQFRIIVAPEDGGDLNMTAFVRELMARVEQDTGRKLEWAAVNHHDTGQRHAHVIVRGVDLQGRELRFDRAYISHGIRWQAQDIVTRELGLRTVLDLERVRARQVAMDRWTELDRELHRRAPEGHLVLHAKAQGRPLLPREAWLVARLEHLERLGFAERKAPREWTLATDWCDRLRELGERGNILKQMHRALGGHTARYRIVQSGATLDPLLSDALPGRSGIEGRIAAKGIDDERRDGFYAVIETLAGSGYRVPLDGRAAGELRVGDIVSVTTRPGEGRAMGGGKGEARSRGPRLRVMVRKLGPSLEEQVARAGPMWLDRIGDRPLAPYGFGAEVRRALDQRADRLRKLGIDMGRF